MVVGRKEYWVEVVGIDKDGREHTISASSPTVDMEKATAEAEKIKRLYERKKRVTPPEMTRIEVWLQRKSRVNPKDDWYDRRRI